MTETKDAHGKADIDPEEQRQNRDNNHASAQSRESPEKSGQDRSGKEQRGKQDGAHAACFPWLELMELRFGQMRGG
jgi:hypothetical protein